MVGNGSFTRYHHCLLDEGEAILGVVDLLFDLLFDLRGKTELSFDMMDPDRVLRGCFRCFVSRLIFAFNCLSINEAMSN